MEKGMKILGENYPDTLASMNNLSSTYQSEGWFVKACNLQEEVMEKRMNILGGDHPHTLHSMDMLAGMYQSQGRYDEASKLEKEVMEKGYWVCWNDAWLTSSYYGNGISADISP
jgi:Tetratricopeptide repeat